MSAQFLRETGKGKPGQPVIAHTGLPLAHFALKSGSVKGVFIPGLVLKGPGVALDPLSKGISLTFLFLYPVSAATKPKTFDIVLISRQRHRISDLRVSHLLVSVLATEAL
jgi:hypothetical protein